MSKVITFSRVFPSYHPMKGKPTYFVEKILRGLYFSMPIINDYFEKLNPNYDWTCNFRADLAHPMNFDPKYHTVRSGNRWKVGDKFSPRVWSGKPYQSKQIIIAPDIEIKKIWEIKTWDISVNYDSRTLELSDGKPNWLTEIKGSNEKYWSVFGIDSLAKNDGLSVDDLLKWFKYPSEFSGQVICWNDKIQY